MDNIWIIIDAKENPLEKLVLLQKEYDLLPGDKRSLYKLL